MTTLVIDASVALKWFIPEVHEVEAKRFLDPGNSLCAPDLLPSEFGNILWKKVRRAEITADEAQRIAAAMQSSPLILFPSLALLPDALRVAVATGCTVYDCSTYRLRRHGGAGSSQRIASSGTRSYIPPTTNLCIGSRTESLLSKTLDRDDR